MNNSKAVELFEKAPVSQAVLKNALPAMAAMLMVLIYNLADTFFIGGIPGDARVPDVHGRWYSVWYGRHLGDLPCAGTGPDGIRQEGLLVLYVGMRRCRRSYVGAFPHFYG